MSKIDVAFEMKEKVRVKSLGLEAFINSIWIQVDGNIQYQLEWLDNNNTVSHLYFSADELEKVV